jgi:transcriptional regulator with XRE-family HTH domain
MPGRLLHHGGPVLRAARERAGATQREVAERAGASTATVSRLENGIALPSDPLLDAILDAYCVITGVPRLELLERAAAAWQRDEYGEVKGL